MDIFGELKAASPATILNGFEQIVINLTQALSDGDISQLGLLVFTLREFIDYCPKELENFSAMYESACNTYDAWRETLRHGDIVSLLYTGPTETQWLQVKLLKDNTNGCDEAGVFKLHFLGWAKNFDEVHNITKFLIIPKQEKEKRSILRKSTSLKAIADVVPTDIDSGTKHLSSVTHSGRVVKRIHNNVATPKGKSRTVSAIRISEFDGRECGIGDKNEWLCAVCGQLEEKGGSDFLLCDGPCLRVWHYNCMDHSWEKPVVCLLIFHDYIVNA